MKTGKWHETKKCGYIKLRSKHETSIKQANTSAIVHTRLKKYKYITYKSEMQITSQMDR